MQSLIRNLLKHAIPYQIVPKIGTSVRILTKNGKSVLDPMVKLGLGPKDHGYVNGAWIAPSVICTLTDKQIERLLDGTKPLPFIKVDEVRSFFGGVKKQMYQVSPAELYDANVRISRARTQGVFLCSEKSVLPHYCGQMAIINQRKHAFKALAVVSFFVLGLTLSAATVFNALGMNHLYPWFQWYVSIGGLSGLVFLISSFLVHHHQQLLQVHWLSHLHREGQLDPVANLMAQLNAPNTLPVLTHVVPSPK